MMPAPGLRRFQLLGGRLAVNFVNTVHSPGNFHRLLEDWPSLLAFLEQSEVISPRRTSALLSLQQSNPQAAESLLRRALVLREALRRSFDSLARGEAPDRESVEPVNEILRVTEGHDELVLEQRNWRLRFIAREERPEWLLAAIARSAAEILTDPAAAALRKCANPACGLFFCDTSRTHRRRWCSMSTCGNRSKVAAFSKRHPHRHRGR